MNPSPHFATYDKEYDLGSVGMAIDSMQGVSVETHTDATNADLSDDENDSSDSESDDDDE